MVAATVVAKLQKSVTPSSRNRLDVTRPSATGGNTREMPTMLNPSHWWMFLANTLITCAWASTILKETSSWTPTGSTKKMEHRESTVTFTFRNTDKALQKSLLCKSSSLFFPFLRVPSWLHGLPHFTSPWPRVVLSGSLVVLKKVKSLVKAVVFLSGALRATTLLTTCRKYCIWYKWSTLYRVG